MAQRILLTTTSYQDTPGKHHDYLAESGLEVMRARGPLSEADMLKLVTADGGFDGLLNGDDLITSKVIDASLPRLKVIAKYGIGLDSIDVKYATAKKIPVLFTPGVNHTTVAEHTFGLMIALAKHFWVHLDATKHGKWKRVTGSELAGKTMAIFGMGRIGKEVAKRARAFDMNVKGYDVYWDFDFAKACTVDRCTTLDDALDEADVISLHMNLDDSNRGFLNKERLAKMKKGAMVINTARGGLVVEQDMADACKSGHLGGYGTDVLDHEPMLPNHPYLGIDNILVTPHVGSRTFESVERQAMRATKNIVNFLKGKKTIFKQISFEPRAIPSGAIMAQQAVADIGLIGLAVMGENLALNIADHGFKVAVYNRTTEVMKKFIARENPPGGLVGCETVNDLVAAVKKPRKFIILVKAGGAVDAVTKELIAAGVEKDDIVVDCGNSLWTDTIRRERDYAAQCKFFGSGVSGGELGARFGPSMMPGGDPDSWKHLKPIWEAVAAKVDAKTGKPLEDYAPGKPVVGGVPCTAYLGPNGAGHYVKMVHNGIEYIDMQLIGEAYWLMTNLLGMKAPELSKVFGQWNQGDLDSYLIQITADILQQKDPQKQDSYFVDNVLDTAGQKGTGKWTSTNALDMGIPANAIAEAVFARCLSALKDERVGASKILKGPAPAAAGNRDELVAAIRDALYCSKICAYAQGFQLMREAQKEYKWKLNFAEIASIFRGGCIIRARFLQKIMDAYTRDADLTNLLLDPYFNEQVQNGQTNWRKVVALAATNGIAVPAFMSALAYYDGYRSARLPANLLQAQRDYFGAHTYERIDSPRGQFFHLDWPEKDRPQITIKPGSGGGH